MFNLKVKLIYKIMTLIETLAIITPFLVIPCIIYVNSYMVLIYMVIFLILLYILNLLLTYYIEHLIDLKKNLLNEFKLKELIKDIYPFTYNGIIKDINYIRLVLSYAYLYLGEFETSLYYLDSINFSDKNDDLFFEVNNLYALVYREIKAYDNIDKLYVKMKHHKVEKQKRQYLDYIENVEVILLEMKNHKEKEDIEEIINFRERMINDKNNHIRVYNYYYLLPIYKKIKDKRKLEKSRKYIIKNGGESFFVKDISD